MAMKVPLIALGLLLASHAYAQDSKPQSSPPEQSQAAATAKTDAQSSAPSTDTEYKIGPQDVVQIDVWKEPEITRTIPVRPDGKISLPLLNDVQAAGLTSMQLAGVIREGLLKYLTNPQVTVTVTLINSRRVYITGEVAKTGSLPLLPNMTVLQALTAAGGFTPFARMKEIYVLRTENGKQVKYPFHYKAVIKGQHPEENIILQPNDTIVVP